MITIHRATGLSGRNSQKVISPCVTARFVRIHAQNEQPPEIDDHLSKQQATNASSSHRSHLTYQLETPSRVSDISNAARRLSPKWRLEPVDVRDHLVAKLNRAACFVPTMPGRHGIALIKSSDYATARPTTIESTLIRKNFGH